MKHLKKFENKEHEKIIRYHDNGTILSISYTLNGKEHREDGPAVQDWYDNRQKSSEVYYINGKFHREDGPSVIIWNDNEIVYVHYYLNNEKYSREEWIEELKKINSPHYEEQKILYDIEKYNL